MEFRPGAASRQLSASVPCAKTRPTSRADLSLLRPCSRTSRFSGEYTAEQTRNKRTQARRTPGAFRRPARQARPGADSFRREAQPRRPCPGADPKRFGRGSGERSGRKRRARTDIAASNGLRQTAPTRNSAFMQIFFCDAAVPTHEDAPDKTSVIFRHRRTHGSAQFASGTICPA